MSDTSENIVRSLEALGFCTVETQAEGELVDEPHAADLSVLSKLDLGADVPQRIVSARGVRYKNEYHDEELTLVQATVLDGPCGLGSVKALAEAFVAKQLGEVRELSLRPAFIYQVVPAIEMAAGGVRFAAGGMLRPEILKKLGLKAAEKSIYMLMITAERAEKL